MCGASGISITPRDAETLRRVALIQRQFAALLVSADWTPYEKTLQAGVFASRFPGMGVSLWAIVNRNEYDVDGEQVALEHPHGVEYFDVWNGVRIEPRFQSGQAFFSLKLEARGFGAILSVSPDAAVEGLGTFLDGMRELARKPLQSFSPEWHSLPQQLVAIEPTRRVSEPPPGMVKVPAAEFDFAVQGIEIEGQTWEGLDVQYPWENSARRRHRQRMSIDAFQIDRHPVTNARVQDVLDATGYRPPDAHNFLRHWQGGAPRAGWENKPVTWVSLEDARAYAKWAGKRLPHEWEWQYAAQGTDGRRYPWGNEWNAAAVPEPVCSREMPPPADVDAHPAWCESVWCAGSRRQCLAVDR